MGGQADGDGVSEVGLEAGGKAGAGARAEAGAGEGTGGAGAGLGGEAAVQGATASAGEAERAAAVEVAAGASSASARISFTQAADKGLKQEVHAALLTGHGMHLRCSDLCGFLSVGSLFPIQNPESGCMSKLLSMLRCLWDLPAGLPVVGCHAPFEGTCS